MRLLNITYLFCLLILSKPVQSQQKYSISLLDSGHSCSLRGLSVPSNNVVWASGSNGTVARSTDGGAHFNWIQVAGFEKRDFRSIHAFDADTAVIAAIAEPAQILRTTDGGAHWKVVFTDSTPGMFLDAMYFAGMEGTVAGDPVNNRLFIAHTENGGRSWFKMKPYMPEAEPGEACFASSGTNLQLVKAQRRLPFLALVTGGTVSRVHIMPVPGSKAGVLATPLPMLQGKETTGANSLAVWKDSWLVVGGDFTKPNDTEGNCVVTTNGGKNWQKPGTPPAGYRSCVIYVDKGKAIACGLNGADVTDDDGFHWQPISTHGFHVVQKSQNGNAIYFAGGKGQIGKLLDIKN